MSFIQSAFKVSTNDGRNFVLLEDVTYICKSGETITIPAGATSDGASTPQAIWNLLPPFGKYWRAAFLHDYLYRLSGRQKSFCDSILLEAMDGCGVDLITRETIFKAVSSFGDAAYLADLAQPIPK